MKVRDFINKVLTGMSIGVIVTLVPPAIMGDIAKALDLTSIVAISFLIQRFLGIIIGLCVAMQFKLTPIQTGTVALTTAIGAGSVVVDLESSMVRLAGLGDVINAGLTAALAVLIILWIGDRLKTYTILLLPTIVIILAGSIGLFTLPYVQNITSMIGEMISYFMTLQPILMGMLMGLSFAFLITSPVSSVGVAVALGLTGIDSGVANLGATAAGFGLAIAGSGVNNFGTTLTHIIGSPKLQMANLAKNPRIIYPILALGAILGAFGAIFNIQGDKISAGFGVVGLVGPIKHLSIVGWDFSNVLVTLLVYLVFPIVFGFLMKWIFINKLQIVKEEDYLVNIK